MLKICLGIFLARVLDVTLGTLRTIYSVKGKQLLAAIIAFFEVLVWFMVAKEALNTGINSIFIPLSYSLGYATGTLLGTYVANHYVGGLECVQIITKKNNTQLIQKIRENGYGLSIVTLKKDYDDIDRELLIVGLNKKSLNKLIDIVKKEDSNAFFMINETKVVQNGILK